MAERGIPRHVRSFLIDELSSMAQLEMLLLLHAEPERVFRPEDVAAALRIDPGWADAELVRLHRRGLLSIVDGAYRYDPQRTDLAHATDGLAKAMSTHRVSVITLLFSTPSDGIGSFADAFKLRRPDDG